MQLHIERVLSSYDDDARIFMIFTKECHRKLAESYFLKEAERIMRRRVILIIINKTERTIINLVIVILMKSSLAHLKTMPWFSANAYNFMNYVDYNVHCNGHSYQKW